MLGLRQIGIVCHGRFTRRGFARAIEVASRGVEEDVIGRTRAALEEAGALRKPGGEGSGGEAANGSSDETAAKPREADSPSEHGATVVRP
jgi:glycerol-3-phosphate acyltransferase PlsX